MTLLDRSSLTPDGSAGRTPSGTAPRRGAPKPSGTRPKTTKREAGRKGGQATQRGGKRNDRTATTPAIEAGGTGRLTNLTADVQTLATLKSLGSIHASLLEAATFLNVTKETLTRFLDRHEEARAAFAFGKINGNVTLRRLQLQAAETNPAMLIWLGMQYLGQKDVVEVVSIDGPNKAGRQEARATCIDELAQLLGSMLQSGDEGAETKAVLSRLLSPLVDASATGKGRQRHR